MTRGSICQPIQAPRAPIQLEIAVTHALFACEQAKQLVDEPQKSVAGERTDDRRIQIRETAVQIEQQAQPQQRQGHIVWQQLVVEVDAREGDQEGREHQSRKALNRWSKMPHRDQEGDRCEEFNQRVSG